METVQTQKYVGKSPEFMAEFEAGWAKGITAEELIERMHKHIDSWPWKDR